MIGHFVPGAVRSAGVVRHCGIRSRCDLARPTQTVPARILADDLGTLCRIAEFVLNASPMINPRSWEEMEAYVAAHFARPNGTFEMSCDQDFLRIERTQLP